MQTELLRPVYLKGGEKYFIHTVTGALYSKRRTGKDEIRYVLKRGRPSNRRVGTLRVSLYINGEYVSMSMALLVLATMKGPRGDEYKPHHKNGDICDCSPANLEWKRNKRKASLWDVLTDEEYALWKLKLNSMQTKQEVKDFNRYAWRRYLRNTNMLARKPWKRKEFFEELFRVGGIKMKDIQTPAGVLSIMEHSIQITNNK